MTQEDRTAEHHYHVGAPPALPLNASPPKKKKVLVPILMAIAVCFLVCCVGFAAYVGSAQDKPDTSKANSTANPTRSAGPAVPEATQAQAPAVQPPSDQSFTGKGDKVIKLAPLDEKFVYIAVITHKGTSNFVVTSLGASGERIDLVVNEIGNYAGTRPVSLEEHPAAFQLEANGTWSITVQVAQKAPSWSGNASGKGDAVYIVPRGLLNGLSTLKATHSGSGNFVIRAFGDRADLLVNEIGKYSGEVLIDDSTALLEIIADGSWTLVKQ